MYTLPIIIILKMKKMSSGLTIFYEFGGSKELGALVKLGALSVRS